MAKKAQETSEPKFPYTTVPKVLRKLLAEGDLPLPMFLDDGWRRPFHKRRVAKLCVHRSQFLFDSGNFLLQSLPFGLLIATLDQQIQFSKRCHRKRNTYLRWRV